MQYRKYIIDFFKVLQDDEELLRLLANTPKNGMDDPLSSSKPNIVGSPSQSAIVKERIIRSPKTSDLPKSQICRVCMYLAQSVPSRTNKKVATQNIVFDVYAHIDKFDAIDVRALWICETIHKLVYSKKITGFGEVEMYQNAIITNAPDGYIGYRMVFNFGSVK